MGAKSLYLDNRKKYREQIRLANDLKALNALERGYERYKKYRSAWQTIDLDDLVSNLFRNPVYENKGQKFVITDKDSEYIIYCDNAGSYFRIGNKNIPVNHRGHYLDSKLQPLLNENIDGKVIGMSKDKREALSHFKMKIKKKG